MKDIEFKPGDLVRYSNPGIGIENAAEIFKIILLVRECYMPTDTVYVRLVHRLPEYAVWLNHMNIGETVYLFTKYLVKVDLKLKKYKKLKHCLEIRNLALQ